jgi:diguanylate cyclase (GGDEF)-like protein
LSVSGKPLRLTPLGLVLMPLALACVITGVAVLAISLNDRLTIAAPGPLLAATLLVYSALLILLGRSAIANIRELESIGMTDTLTHLPNRRALHEDVERLSSGGEEVALALIDLDSFKQVNDHYGHAVGDQLIEQCARMLRDLCGTEAYCYRLGGDEFAAVMGGKVAGTILEGMCRTLLERLATPVGLNGRQITVGASIGLARSTAENRVPSSELLRRSDVAMYMSKRGGDRSFR